MTDASRIGGKIRTLRESLNLSPEQLAERCACDVSVIRELEGGSLALSLSPLIRVTRALGMRLGTLLDDDSQMGPVVTRADENNGVERVRSLEAVGGGNALDFFSLAMGKSSRHMEPFIIDVKPSGEPDASLSSHEGEEFIYVLSGTIEIEYGRELHLLEPGDSIYYDSIVPHQVRSRGGQTARILAVVYAPC